MGGTKRVKRRLSGGKQVLLGELDAESYLNQCKINHGSVIHHTLL